MRISTILLLIAIVALLLVLAFKPAPKPTQEYWTTIAVCNGASTRNECISILEKSVATAKQTIREMP